MVRPRVARREETDWQGLDDRATWVCVMKRYARPVSFIERLWVAIDRFNTPFANQFFLEGKGQIDPGLLQHAVEVASEANPGSRLVWEGRLRKSTWVDSGMTPPIRRVQAGAWTGRDDEHTSFLEVPLPIHGPTCDVTVIEGETSRLLFRSSHAVMDGRGMMTWMEDVFRVVRGEKPIGADSVVTDSELLESFFQKRRPFEDSRCLPPTGPRTNTERGVAWRRITINGSHSNVLGKVAVALARSARKYQQGRFCIQSPIDLRQRSPGLRSTANLTVALLVELFPDSTPEYVHERIRKVVEGSEELPEVKANYDPGSVPLWLLSLIVKMVFRSMTRKGNLLWPVVSNLGRIDPELFSGGGFRMETMFPVPPMSEGNAGFVGISGVNGRVEICCTAPRSICGDGRLDALMDDIRRMFDGDLEKSRPAVA